MSKINYGCYDVKNAILEKLRKNKMNQIEFINKHGKAGDRIEDGNFKCTLSISNEPESILHYYHNDSEQLCGFAYESIYNQEPHEWQSPKIYRLMKSDTYKGYDEKPKGYLEDWRIIADYADEAKEESSLRDLVLETIHTSTSKTDNALLELAKQVDSRLKALEGKIK